MAVAALSERIRTYLGDRPGLVEKKMFGSIAFMLHGNMVVAPMNTGNLLVRVGKAGQAEALARPGAAIMSMGGRSMSGFIDVDAGAIEDDDALAGWIDIALAFVRSLPPK